MSLWPQSDDVGRKPAGLPNVDTIPEQSRMASGSTSISNDIEGSPAKGRIYMRDDNFIYIRSDGSVSAIWAVVPEYDIDTPIRITAKPGYDVYIDILNIPRPSFL